jgi:hypothetical protein
LLVTGEAGEVSLDLEARNSLCEPPGLLGWVSKFLVPGVGLRIPWMSLASSALGSITWQTWDQKLHLFFHRTVRSGKGSLPLVIYVLVGFPPKGSLNSNVVELLGSYYTILSN